MAVDKGTGRQRRFVDLHTHSTASDGTTPPAEVVRLADAAGMAAVALTDHDTVAGLAEARAAAAAFPNLRLIPGIEVSAKFPPPAMVHLLGLGIDEQSSALRDLMAEFRIARAERNPKIIARLQALGVPLDMDDVRAAATPAGGEPIDPAAPRIIGRMHIAEAMRRKGLVPNTREAFARYLGEGGPAYVEKDRLRPGEVIRRLKAAGAVAVLAHPVHLHFEGRLDLERAVREMMDAGLGGIEVYHSDHNDEQTRMYLDLARKLNLLVTGGSDFHGQTKPTVRLGHPRVPLAAITGEWADRWLR
jgi:predicted metal-dependent phosphoesterase TrpH